MTLGQRIMLTVFIVLAILLALAVAGYFTGSWEEDPLPVAQRFGLASAETRSELCMDDDTRERVRRIMIQALDTALQEKIEQLFQVWLQDSTGQPARATKGMDNALRAYVSARASAARFSPPECSG